MGGLPVQGPFLRGSSQVRHLVIILAQGLVEREGLTSELPNLGMLQREGISAKRCWVRSSGDPIRLFRDLSTPHGQATAPIEQTGGVGRLGFYFLPLKSYADFLSHSEAPYWSVTEHTLDINIRGWSDLLTATPRFQMKGREQDAAREFFQDRILARFPRAATRDALAHPSDPLGAEKAWMEWISDAFTRGLWYASGQTEQGILAVLFHPAPLLLANRSGSAGLQWAEQHLDDLLGRLIVLREHRDLEGSVLLFLGTGPIARDPEAPFSEFAVPLAVTGPGLEDFPEIDEMNFGDLARWLRKLAGTAPEHPQ